jgi:type VI secretion system protein
MSEQRLIERYAGLRFEAPRSPEPRPGSSLGRAEPDYQVSIKGHLWRLLNTRRGSAMIDSDYGVPDMALGSRAHDVAEIERILKQVIGRYEQRLQQLRLTVLPDDNPEAADCRFLIQGLLVVNREQLPVELTAVLRGDGTCDFE